MVLNFMYIHTILNIESSSKIYLVAGPGSVFKFVIAREQWDPSIRRTFWMTWNESLATGFWLIDHENEIARDSSEETKKYISNR